VDSEKQVRKKLLNFCLCLYFFFNSGIFPFDRNVFDDNEFTSETQMNSSVALIPPRNSSSSLAPSVAITISPAASFSQLSRPTSTNSGSGDNEPVYTLTRSQLKALAGDIAKEVTQLSPSLELPPGNRLELITNESNNNIISQQPQNSERMMKMTPGPPKKRGRPQGSSRILTSSPVRDSMLAAASAPKKTTKKKKEFQVNTMVLENSEKSSLISTTKAAKVQPVKPVSKKLKRAAPLPLHSIENASTSSKKPAEVKRITRKTTGLIPPSRIKKEPVH
jgi:hypothetical protein